MEILLLVTAVSVDAFAAGFVYGTNKIKIPLISVLVVAGVSSLVLGIALLLGSLTGSLLPDGLDRYTSFVILMVLGVTKLFDRSQHDEAGQADKNQDRYVSPREAVTLGAALSVDCLAAGIGASVRAAYIPVSFLASLLIGTLAILSGRALGRAVSARCKSNLCWISGILLIALALMELF